MTLAGAQSIGVLLCKFSDTAEKEPHPASFYKDMFKRSTGGLNDYWIAASLGAINLDGSKVLGWKTFDVTRGDYLADHPHRADMIDGAVERFGIDPAQFAVVLAIFNADVNGGSSSSGVLSGPTGHLTFLAHELGHRFKIAHSFDHSDRRLKDPKTGQYAQKGEYYDRYDIMSANNVQYEKGHRFSPRGPLLNTANLDRMGWLPPGRVWRPLNNSSGVHDVTIVALSHPEVPGHLAAEAGGWIAEFRMPDGFDAGLRRPTVLFHDYPADPNSFIIASDPSTHNCEWQPGQTFWNQKVFEEIGGVKATVVDFDLRRKTAHLRLEVKAVRPPFISPDILFGLGIGQLPVNGQILVLQNGKIVPVPIPEPDFGPAQLELAALSRTLRSFRNLRG